MFRRADGRCPGALLAFGVRLHDAASRATWRAKAIRAKLAERPGMTFDRDRRMRIVASSQLQRGMSSRSRQARGDSRTALELQQGSASCRSFSRGAGPDYMLVESDGGELRGMPRVDGRDRFRNCVGQRQEDRRRCSVIVA